MIRILTFNIRAGREVGGRLDLGRTADVIAAVRPDVVGLQEVDRHFSERSAFHDQPGWLAARLGWSYGFAPALDRDPASGRAHRRQYGLAILTPHRMLNFAAHRLTNLASGDAGVEVRAAAQARIAIGGSEVEVFNTHLDQRDPEQRAHQAAQVNRLAGAAPGPTVVMGDLNAGRDTSEVRTLAQGFVDAAGSLAGAAALTYPCDEPRLRLDYIFVRRLRPVRATVLDVRSSDHRPVLVELQPDRALRTLARRLRSRVGSRAPHPADPEGAS